MPNGGYPMQFMMSIEGTDLALLLTGTTITVVRFSSAEDLTRARYRLTRVAAITDDQVEALVYHLAYWGNIRQQDGINGSDHLDRTGGEPGQEHGGWTFNGRRVVPRFRTKGCSYDY